MVPMINNTLVIQSPDTGDSSHPFLFYHHRYHVERSLHKALCMSRYHRNRITLEQYKSMQAFCSKVIPSSLSWWSISALLSLIQPWSYYTLSRTITAPASALLHNAAPDNNLLLKTITRLELATWAVPTAPSNQTSQHIFYGTVDTRSFPVSIFCSISFYDTSHKSFSDCS